MATKKRNNINYKTKMSVTQLNRLFNDAMDKADKYSNGERQKELDRMHHDIDDIISDRLDDLSSFAGDDIGVFFTKLFNEQDRDFSSKVSSLEEIFESEKNGVFELFNQKYRNRLSLYEDLETISEYLFELGEAINTTRDSILSSDDISNTISYSLSYGEYNTDNNLVEAYNKAIKKFEDRFSLLQKLKEHIVPNTLKYGTYYVYTIPYSDLFQSYYDKNANNIHTATTEGFTMEEADSIKKSCDTNETKSVILERLNSYAQNIEICNEHEALPVIEGVDLSALIDNDKFEKLTKSSMSDNGTNYPIYNDGVKVKKEDFSSVADCHIEYLDPRKVIPIKILNKVIGYYYIKEIEPEINKNTFTNTFSMNLKKDSIDSKGMENEIVGKLASKVTKSLDKKFVEDNGKFKDLIANALIYDDTYKKRIRFQFIPAKYITEFAVNLDINGNGTSILYPSLFYAKIYLGLLIFKMMSIITKSNDTRITYVKNSGVDKDIAKQVQAVGRSLKQREINFNDLMSSNITGMISRVGAAKDIFMPVGISGEKAIDFDTLAGQDVDFNNDLMEMLRSGYITATGVPSVMMNYINEADYVKTLVMAHSKYVGHVMGHQFNFNRSITELYKKIMLGCTDIPKEVVNNFKFTLSAPKAANNVNMGELINNANTISRDLVAILTGENNENPVDPYVKDILTAKIFKEYMPMIDWGKMEKMKKESEIEATKLRMQSSDAANEVQ